MSRRQPPGDDLLARWRRSRQAERCLTIQSSKALSKPMSYPAFSLSIHLCLRISSRSAKNSLYNTEFLTSSEASSFGGSIDLVIPQCVDNSLPESNQNRSF